MQQPKLITQNVLISSLEIVRNQLIAGVFYRPNFKKKVRLYSVTSSEPRSKFILEVRIIMSQMTKLVADPRFRDLIERIHFFLKVLKCGSIISTTNTSSGIGQINKSDW